MPKECGLCGFRTDDDAAFPDHMRTVHAWGAPAPFVPARAAAEDAGVAKFCGRCGAPRDAASTNFCRNCGAAFAAGSSTAPPPASLAFAPKGGFWRRAAAYLVDGVVLGIVGYLVGLVVGVVGDSVAAREADLNLVGRLIGELVGLAYFLFFWSAHGAGQTLGMRALGLRVIRTDGTYMTVGRAFLRNVGFGISTLAVGLGLVWVAFDHQKQGWHDKIADTYVVRTA